MRLHISVQLVYLPPLFGDYLIRVGVDALTLGPRLPTLLEQSVIHVRCICRTNQLHLVLVLQDSSYEVLAFRLAEVERVLLHIWPAIIVLLVLQFFERRHGLGRANSERRC